MAVSAEALKIQDEKFKSLGLQKMVVNKEQVCSYSRGLGAAKEGNPVLVLIHGYPQSSYMWRHLIPLLPADAPIFAPDLPGYGASAPIEKNDKLSVGSTLLAALRTEVKRTSSTPPSTIPVVLIGHDRGARVAHRLAVSGAEGIDIVGVCLIDIVPTTVQWATSATAAEVPGDFHWSLLANVNLATRLIKAFGPANWCAEMMMRWAGTNTAGLNTLQSDNAFNVYAKFLEQDHTIDTTNKDYEAGATVDVKAQKQDQKDGRKIKASLLLVYSESYIGRKHNVYDVWRDWVDEGVDIKALALRDGIGHFGAEEAPRETAKAVNEWLEGTIGAK